MANGLCVCFYVIIFVSIDDIIMCISIDAAYDNGYYDQDAYYGGAGDYYNEDEYYNDDVYYGDQQQYIDPNGHNVNGNGYDNMYGQNGDISDDDDNDDDGNDDDDGDVQISANKQKFNKPKQERPQYDLPKQPKVPDGIVPVIPNIKNVMYIILDI